MNCIKCDGETAVIDSRSTRRRRQCKDCGTRFSTLEILAEEVEAARSVAQIAPKPKLKRKPRPSKKAAPTKVQRGEARRRIEDRITDADLWAEETNFDTSHYRPGRY